MRKYRVFAALLAGCSVATLAAADAQPTTPQERHAYFGDLHLHTTMSFDAWTFGTKVTPDQAYKFASGQTIMVPASQLGQEEGFSGKQDVPAKRAWALDFLAVTDHSEFMGAFQLLDNPNSAFSQTATGKEIKSNPRQAFVQWGPLMKKGATDLKAALTEAHAWDIEQEAANDNYRPGVFTTFIAYEFTASKNGRTLHRNVFFNADHAPMPFSSADSQNPEDLWTYLESVRAQGIDVIAAPHNANVSGGLAYDWNTFGSGKPMDEAYAQRRVMNEPLTEIVQNKGSSDTAPSISTNDEFANFEMFEKIFPGQTAPVEEHGGYVRDAFGRGLVIQAQVGVNPFKYGIEGSSDIHNGMTTQDENAMAGGPFGIDPHTMLPKGNGARASLDMAAVPGTAPADQNPDGTPKRYSLNDFIQFSSGGLTGVWAEENTRDSIFAAFRRKETFATSGVRVRVRAFGGWNFDSKMTAMPNWTATAYMNGVPMGSDLPARPADAGAPRLALWAVKDPDGANLDRIQVIKLWLEGSDYKEKIFDAALSGTRKASPTTGKAPAVGNTVNLKTGSYTNKIGATELKTVWQDPEFDSTKPAVYYVRVLQIPTPRWSTLLSIKNKLPISKVVAATIQERAWGSPIWYTPAK